MQGLTVTIRRCGSSTAAAVIGWRGRYTSNSGHEGEQSARPFRARSGLPHRGIARRADRERNQLIHVSNARGAATLIGPNRNSLTTHLFRWLHGCKFSTSIQIPRRRNPNEPAPADAGAILSKI
jgi:hypothetical protein